MVNIAIFVLAMIIGFIFLYKFKQSDKKFNTSVDQFNSIFHEFITNHGLENIDYYVSDLPKTKKKIKSYVMKSLHKNIVGFDFLIVELQKGYETTVHKHLDTSVFLYALKGSIDIWIYPGCIDCHLPENECDHSKCTISTIKNGDYSFINNDLCHKIVANKNTKVMMILIPSIIKSNREKSCMHEEHYNGR